MGKVEAFYKDMNPTYKIIKVTQLLQSPNEAAIVVVLPLDTWVSQTVK